MSAYCACFHVLPVPRVLPSARTSCTCRSTAQGEVHLATAEAVGYRGSIPDQISWGFVGVQVALGLVLFEYLSFPANFLSTNCFVSSSTIGPPVASVSSGFSLTLPHNLTTTSGSGWRRWSPCMEGKEKMLTVMQQAFNSERLSIGI
jgi:hypothetical protein